MNRSANLFAILIAICCATVTAPKASPIDSALGTRVQVVDSIIEFGKTFVGKAYKSKGPTNRTMDCSGFLGEVFGKFNHVLARSSELIAKQVNPIGLNDVRKGDFLFFKGSDSNSPDVGHASLVIGINAGTISMLHSCSRGILIEDYQASDYYLHRFLFAGRLPALEEAKISIIGVGDMMLGTNFPSASYLPPNDGKDLLTPVKDILTNADITFGNMEGAIMTGPGTAKRCQDSLNCYVFKSPDHYANYFQENGFDVVNLANNHAGDFGPPGKQSTWRILKEVGIEYAGPLEQPYTIFKKNGITYGFCAFSPNSGTSDINDLKNAASIVKHLDSLSDIVIVSFHGGAEGAKRTHITKSDEIFLGENRGDPYHFARAVIDAGADVVFGHGPHVTRAIDLYKGRFIAYSLGNFATYGRFNLKGNAGLAPIIKVFLNKKGEFQSGSIVSTKQLGEGGPVLDSSEAVLHEIISLTQADVPDAPLVIDKDGEIKKK
jgi:hypothetical protein